jgi:hypothetical protein
MPIFPRAVLILERGVIFVRSLVSYADRPISYRALLGIRVKASLLAKGLGTRCA